MAEIDETSQGNIIPQDPNASQMIQDTPVPESNVPQVSDINFEDIADTIGSPAGNLASLQFRDPVFEGMLRQAAIPINSAPPMTGLHSANNMLPGKATQNYNPYTDSTPPDMTTIEGKKRMMMQGMNQAMINPRQEKAPGYRSDLEYGIRETNFDRYYAHEKFDELGFHPFRNNEETYNANSTFWDDHARSWKQTSRTYWTGFTSSYDAMADWMSGDGYLSPDRDGAAAFVDAMRIGNSSKENIGGAANRFMLNSGYTFGIISNIMAEEIVLAGITALSGTAAAPVALARSAQNVGRAKQAYNLFKTAFKSGVGQSTRISAGAKLMHDLNKVENARHFFSAVGEGALNFVAPGTMQAIQQLNTSKSVVRGINSVKNANALFGGFYRDARQINLAISESKLEAGIVYNEMIDGLYHDYVAEFGNTPPTEKMDDIRQKATAASSSTLAFNAPLIYLSNKIVLSTLFQGMGGGLSRLTSQYTGKYSNRIFRNTKTTPGAAKATTDLSKKILYDGGETFLKRLKNLGVKGSAGAMGAFALRYTGANFAEGVQELSQEVIAKTAEDYYTGLFLDPSSIQNMLLDSSLNNAIKAQISPQGFEVFMSGFLMGGLVQPVQQGLMVGLPTLYQMGKGNFGTDQQKADWQQYKKTKEEFLAKSLVNLNLIAEDPLKYFDPTKLNAVEQKQINQRLLQSSLSSDMLSFMDDKDQSMFSQLDYLFNTGKSSEFKYLLEDYNKLSNKELLEGFPEYAKEIKSGKFREKIEKSITKIDEFKKGWDMVKMNYPNPHDASKYMPGSAEWDIVSLQALGYDHSVKLLMYTQDTFKRSLERTNSIFERLGNDSAISNMNPSDISVLMDLKSLKTQMQLLKGEIELGATTAGQQELIDKKTKRLKLLQDYYDIITNPENFTNRSKNNIAMSAKTDMEKTEETGDDTVEIGGQRYKAARTITSEVGTFDRRKINKLAPAFKAYLNFLAAQKGEFIQSNDLNDVLKDIVDYKFLKGRSQTYFRAIENINNPEAMGATAERIAERLKIIYDRNKSDVEVAVKKYVDDLEKNELINQFASQLIYPDSDQVILFFQEGIIPTIFQSPGGQVTAQDNKGKWETIQNLIKAYQNRPGTETTVKPGDAITEDEINDESEFDRLANQAEEKVTEISESTNNVLIAKWKLYIKSKIGTSGKVLSWKDWQNTKDAKNIKAIRAELDLIYSSNLNLLQQEQKSFDTWLFENQRTPEVYRIINSKGGTISDYIITDSDTAQTEKLDAGDSLVPKEGNPLGINILKKLVSGQLESDDEYFYEIVDNNMNNLYETYKENDPNGDTILDTYPTLGKAIAAQEIIIRLLPSNSTFGPFQGIDFHYKQVLQDNNDNLFSVITTPSSFNSGGKLYVRPLETANDRSTSFEVKDASQYRPLDTTVFKASNEQTNLLKLRQSEPIRLYAKRADNETAEDAQVRLSERLKQISQKQAGEFTLKVSRNSKWDNFLDEKPGDRGMLGTKEFNNPRLRIGSEELTVAVMNGREVLGYLQGPTGAIILDEYGKVINPLSLTEEQAEEYFNIYKTSSTQLRTTAEQLQIIKNNYASSILLNNKLKVLLGDSQEADIPLSNIKGLDIRISPGKMSFAAKNKGVTFSELESNTVDGKNIWVVDNRSDGNGGIITNITDDEVYEKTDALINASTEQSGYNPLNTKSRYVAATRLPNGTFTFVELKASELTADQKNQLALDILNEQDKTLAENIDVENDEVKDSTANFAFNEKLKDEFYVFGKTGEFIDIELTSRGDVQVIYRNTKKAGQDGKALKTTYTVNENELKGVKESANPFNEFLNIVNNKIKFKDSSAKVKTKLKLVSDNFRSSISKEATVQDLASVLTNFNKGLRENIRVEAVISDSAQINNILNNAPLPSFIKNDVQKQIENTDQILVNAEIDAPELTPEYMRRLFTEGYVNIDTNIIKTIARKLSTNVELSAAERTIYTNNKNTQVRDDINLLKLTYRSGVIEEGGSSVVDATTETTEKSPTKKVADKIEELELELETLESDIWKDTYESIASEEQIKADPSVVQKGNIAANEAIENSEELKDIEAQIAELKKNLAPKVINERLGQEHIEQIDEFITWSQQNLPDFIQIQDIRDLSARLKENGKTAGMFTLELNTLGNNIEGNIYVGAQTPFKYHEAFHGVFRMLLSESEIKKYLSLAKKEKLTALRKEGKKLSVALNELRSSHSVYNNLSKTELEHRLYEEYLADKFDAFKMSAKGTKTSSEIKSLFTRILEWIKAVVNRFSKNELTTLFENIDSAKYSTSSVQFNRFTNATETGVTSAAPKVIAIESFQSSYMDPFTGQEIVSMSNVYMPANDQRQLIATISALYRSYVGRGDLLTMSKRTVLNTAIADYTKLLDPTRSYYTSEENGISYRSIRKKLKTYFEALKTNRDVIAENVSNYLAIFDAKFQIEQDALEENDQNEDTNLRRVDQYGKDASQIGGAMSLSTELREFIATTVLTEQDIFGNTETLEGTPIVTTVDFNFAYSGLLKALSDKTSDLELLRALALFSSSNKNTAAVANNIFNEIGISDPTSLLDAEQLPEISNPNFLQKVVKGFNMFRVDYMFAHKDQDTGIVFLYAANKKDDAHSQIDQWSQHFDEVYPTLLSDTGKKKAVSLLNLFYSKLQNPKERSRNDLDILAKAESKKIYDQLGIQLNPETIKYSILSTKVVRKNWEEAIVSLGLSAGADPITAEDIAELRNSISRGENIFLDNQTNIPENEAEEQNTSEVIEQSTGISSRLKKMANANAKFDETIGATVFRDPKGNLIYAHQMPTFHLVKIAEMSNANWASTKLQENKFFNRNYLLNNNKFLAHAKAGKLKVSRFIGSKEGRVTENEQGSLIENRGLNVNQKEGVSFGESTGAEFIADVLNAYVYNYNRNSQSVPLNEYNNKEGKELFYITAPVDLKVLSDASSSDFVDLPIEKMIEQDDSGDIKLTEHTLDALINNILQYEYERVADELNPELATKDVIEGFNTDIIKKGVQTGQRGKRFVRSRGFITARKSKIKILGGIKTPLMSEGTRTDIATGKQKIILRGGKALGKIGLDSGQESPVSVSYKIEGEVKFESLILKNKGLVSIDNVNLDEFLTKLGEAKSTKPFAGKKKQNTAKLGDVTYYFQRGDDAKFFDGSIQQYAYEFIPLEEAGVEIGVEEEKSYYEGNITPSKNTIFVFGSNPEGRHGKGAAKIAKDKFGAIYGQGEGLQGNAYGLPTKDLRIKKDKGFKSISSTQIIESIKALYNVANQNSNKQFKIAYRNTTETSLNGYTGLEMIEMFNTAGNIPSNIVFSKEWIDTGLLEVETSGSTEPTLAYFESDTFIEETLINAAKEGLSFDDAVKRIGEDKLKGIIEERMLTDFFDFRRLLTNTKAVSKLSSEITEGLGMIVRPEKGQKGKAYHKVTSEGKKAMTLYNLKENNIDYNLAQIYMHGYVNARSFNDILLGDHALLFENFTAETKRAKMQAGAGSPASIAIVAPEFGIDHTFMSDDSISLFTYHDPKVQKRFSDGTIESTDAQMFGTVKAFRYMWFGVGKMSPAQSNLLDKVERGEKITADEMWGNVKIGTEGYLKLNAIINSKKYVYGDGQTFLKMSFFMLSKELTSFKNKFGEWEALPQMEELHNLRVKLEQSEEGTEKVSLAIPTSGSKMMKKNVITAEEMYNSKSIAEIQENYRDVNGDYRSITQGLNPKWMRLQVINPSNKLEGIDPRQMKQLITTEQTDKVEVVIGGVPISIKKIKEAYHKSVSDQVILRYRNKRNLVFNLGTALDEIGNSVDANKVTVNLRSFLRYAIAGLEASHSKTQMLEFFSFDEAGNPKFNLNNPITIDKFQELFLGYFSKGVLAGKQAEITAALVSSHGAKPMRKVLELDENDQPLRTEIIRMDDFKKMKRKPKVADKFIQIDNEPGKWVGLKVGDVILQKLQHNVYDPVKKEYYSEFMMAAHHREVYKNLKPGDTIPIEIAEALGIRIPSQDKHSAMSLRLVDFLPVFYGSSAMFSDELIEISGADFDIDKLFMHIKEWYYAKGQFNEYGKSNTDKGRYAEYIRNVLSQVNRKGSAINEAVTNWSTNDSQFLDEQGVEDLQDELARQTASELKVNASLFKEAYTAKVIGYILEINDKITDEQIIKLYNKNEDLYGALISLGLPVTLKEYKEYVEMHGEPYEAAINNDILDQRIALISNEGIVKPIDGRKVGLGNEPADLKPLYEIREYLEDAFPELADFANPEDIDPDSMLGLLETWNSIKTGEGGIGAAVRPNVVLSMLGENNIKVQNKKGAGRELYPQIRFNNTTFSEFATKYSQEGKTNDKATRTQYLISALITMMTDNAKERLADVLSINKNSLAVVTTLSSLGVPIKTSMLLLKNPIIKLGYDLAINKVSPMDPGISSILNKRLTFLNNDYEISNVPVTNATLTGSVINDWVDPTLPLTSGFGSNITGQTPEGYTDEDASIEYSILKQFLNARRLTDYTGKLGSLVDLLAGFGRSTQNIDKMTNNFKELGIGLSDSEFKKLKDKNGIPIPIDVRSIFEGNDFRATYYKIFKEVTENLLPNVFITRTDEFTKIKNSVVANMIQSNMLVDEKRVNAIEKDILSYLTIISYKQFLLNSPDGAEKLGSLQNGLIYDDLGGENTVTIDNVITSIRNYFKAKGKENYFINKFIYLDVASNDNNKSSINRAKSNNWTKMSDSQVVDLQASFAEIYSEPALRTHAYDLVHYLLVKDGMQFKNNTFLNAVPGFMFDRVLNSISAGHTLLKSKTATEQSYNLVFGKSSEQLANDFVEGYLKSNQNSWLLPVVKSITTDKAKPAHINKEGNLIINIFNGVKSFTENKGTKVIKGKKYKFQREGKSIFVDQKSKQYKALAKNINQLGGMGFTFEEINKGEKPLELVLPLYIRNIYTDDFGTQYVKIFELQKTYREKRFSKSDNFINMLDGEDLVAKGYQAEYAPVELVGSNQVTPVSFALGEVPTYKSLRDKYKSDPMDNLINSLNLDQIEEDIKSLANMDAAAMQDLYNQATNSGSPVSNTNKSIMINGVNINNDPKISDPADNFDYDSPVMNKDVLNDQIAGTQLLMDLLSAKENEKSNKSDVEIAAIREWWADVKTDKYSAQKYTKRSGIDGILNEFDTFDGTAERFIEIIENCK
tara:strand:- start:6352 stop:21756 length:15405 start_codon:yes stop_codon:yes gene_type:complete